MTERLSVQVGKAELTFETGRIAKQAHGSVLVTQGDTTVLSVTCVSPEAREGQGFFPLTVDYREKSSAAGRVPGNYFRREGRPSEREILVCRLTDRPIRPLFPKGFFNEVQVCSTVFSADNENDPDVMAINGASAALHLSRIPFAGPIGAVRVGMIDGEFVINPSMIEEMDESTLDVVVAGTKDAICMVEGRAEEIPEDKLLEALALAHDNIIKICECIEELRGRCGEEKMPFEPTELNADVVADVEAMAASGLKDSLAIKGKHERQDVLDALKAEVKEKLGEKYGEELSDDISSAFGALEKKIMRDQIIETSTRVDGRGLEEVRPITIEVGFLPRAHGSCLFTRGETQAIVTTTLGTSRDEQRTDELTGQEFRRFLLHYNFPAWSVGEVRRIMGPGRREVGHGKLAERALDAVVPHENLEDEEVAADDFPYTVRVLSDITESNGSSSMATVCGGCLSMMDAGVPVKDMVAGVAMGLIMEGDEARVLTDILGVEDHLGDMDFKVCGTDKGITAIQMDVKIKGISRELMDRAMRQARDGRMHILGKMAECLSDPRAEISPYAPRIHTLKIDVEKIRDVIGPGGKIIRGIQAKTGAEIDIQDDGTINVASVDKESADEAIAMIKAITAEAEVGALYKGTVVRLMNFGAFVNFMPGKDGLVHISELAPGRVNEVEDVVKIGDEIDVKVIEIDKMGRINLSKIQAEIDLGIVDASEYKPRPKGGDRGDRGGRDRGGRDRGGRDRGRGGDRGGRGRDRR